MDTIFALASAPGRAGVAVIRISGPAAFPAVHELTGAGMAGRGLSVRRLFDSSGDVLDDAVVLGFPGPGSFTGEDVVELQIHGSVAGVSAVLGRLAELPDLRLAEPGEFTRRALENNRMDLAQVEGLADLIDAETEAQRKQAQAVLGGALGAVADGWREKLIRAAALIEATIDFAEEEVPVDVTPEVSALLIAVQDELSHEIKGVRIAERIRSGFEVAIVGPPNAGKSTLLNTLAGRAAAITSEIAGTTRDVIEVRMDLAGLPVTLLDTAGLREAEDKVEAMGVALARERAAAADLRVFLMSEEEVPQDLRQNGDIAMRPKADLLMDASDAISGLTGQGVDVLVSRIEEILTHRSASAGLATRERHRWAMMTAQDGLIAAQGLLEQGPEMYDLAAEDLRHAIRALESLVGRVDVENLLDEIFSSFCLGK
ncbi:tRNA uridine-5-carboxymethylaminomethyl(34) synthesis GTPase MnmE [Chachezhania antarctica]|mgnify:CR=1 FL=1|uniref:tRNA uridine-5-carboxymethylaminomethyl(34) synthesis GTPase MnmE n=1 Tax=Chachezhania antarctica TaxID=2340860 RepID=UPI000EB0860C|nr:tRNA uridine-5-carboxymethylaminomethyl(34) synthesis GTPase MnmE [Chachezhania antarctica]|tara:strand:+ start:5522 stop:6808 length:1287 start_codon:yes stop_codon:yes gene_type:complete